jgi:general secretion pathway protein F
VTDPVAATARWRYRAAAADGAAVRGEIDASSERDAVDALRRRSLWVVELERVATTQSRASTATREGVGDASSPSSLPARATGGWRLPWTTAADTDLAVVIRSMATLLGAGVPLYRALTYAAQEAGTAAQRAAFGAVRAAIERGDALSAAVAAQPIFPPVFAPLIAAGESSGTLDSSLALLADHLERRDALRAKVRGALIYPAILGLASLVGVIVILLVVVPRFADLVADSGGTLPASTRLLMALSVIVTKGWWIILLGLAAAAALVEQALRAPAVRRRFHARRLSWPVVGRLEQTQVATGYTGTLAIGLRAGVSMLGAMALARGVVRNQSMADALKDAEARVRSGGTLAESLRGVMPPLTERLLEAGEASGDVAGMAARAAEAADGELQRTIAQAVALIEPIMILGFGGVVGFVALALLQAIYGLNASAL